MKIIFYGTREYDHYYFDVLAADPEYGCGIKFLTANLDADTAPLAQGGDAVCAFVNADCSAPVLEKLAQVGIRCLLLRCAGYNNVDLAAAQKCGITVLRVPGYSPEAVAEHAMALAQAANRRICKAYIKVRNNNFALDGLLGYNLYGSSAGIVGTGRIGAAILHGVGVLTLGHLTAQGGGSCRGAGIDHQPGHTGVQPVHHPHKGVRCVPVGPQRGGHALLAGKPGGLVQHHKGGIFVENVHSLPSSNRALSLSTPAMVLPSLISPRITIS